MNTTLLGVAPVLPSANIARDTAWYREKTGFEILFENEMYAVLYRDAVWLHLQWHADTEDDPLLGGSVIRIFVSNISALFAEFVERGTVAEDKLRMNTPWHTHEFGFYDLNRNAVFMAEDINTI
jgi:hypothetical protein